MRSQLLERGLEDAVFHRGDGEVIEGEAMERLCRVLATMEDSLINLEKRGIALRTHAERIDAEGRLPMFHVFFKGKDYWFSSRNEQQEFIKQQEQAEGGELLVDVDGADGRPDENANGNGEGGPVLHPIELHEVRTINSGLKDLASFGLTIKSLIPEDRTGIEDPRYVVSWGERKMPLEDLRELLPKIRKAGERELHVTRFKGLGEMNAEELRETTLDPENRTLVRVTMQDAGGADTLFRTLMGERVEPRREFIEKHALDAQIDV